MKIHASKYIHSSAYLMLDPVHLRVDYLISLLRRNLLVNHPTPTHSQGGKLTKWVLPHTGFIPYNSRSAVRSTASSFRRPGDRQPRRCSRKAVARDYPRLTGYGYVMQQALPPPPLSRAE